MLWYCKVKQYVARLETKFLTCDLPVSHLETCTMNVRVVQNEPAAHSFTTHTLRAQIQLSAAQISPAQLPNYTALLNNGSVKDSDSGGEL